MPKKQLKLTLVKSRFGRNPIHKKTLVGLGLRKINQSVQLAHTPAILGMAKQVSYLLNIEEI